MISMSEVDNVNLSCSRNSPP